VASAEGYDAPHVRRVIKLYGEAVEPGLEV
jgi:hypothetical protein